jgi:hypothetical protein
VLVEELLRGPDLGVPADYKMFVFHGRSRFVQVDGARFGPAPRTSSTATGRRCP